MVTLTMAFKLSSPSPTPLISPPPPVPIQPHTFTRTTTSISKTTKLKLSITSSFQSKSPTLKISRNLPARDRVIDFGKYKGRMLGSLPSTYLKWASKNLLTQDFENWGKLADEVLNDPIYRDRIEWEFAENILTGNKSAALSRGRGAASELQEISETFGWDFEDEVAWRKVDFELLGTSKGGRIPRVVERGEREKERKVTTSEGGSTDGERRRERRERMKQKREVVIGSGRGTSFDVGGTSGRSGEVEGDKGGSGIRRVPNRFPGRDALLRKAMDRERLA